METEYAEPGELTFLREAFGGGHGGEGAGPFGAEFGFTSAEAGFTGWVRHWAAGRAWYDTE